MKREEYDKLQEDLNRSFWRLFTGVGNGDDAKAVMEWLDTAYVFRGALVKSRENGMVDPYGTVAAAAQQYVVAEIKRRVEAGGRLD